MRRAALAALLALAACSRGAPSGQVVARVDGIEITRRDLQTERVAAGLPATDAAAARRALLDRAIDHALLVAEARRQHLDEDQALLAATRGARDAALIARLADTVARQVPEPDRAALDRAIAANPQMTRDRRLVWLARLGGLTPRCVALATGRAPDAAIAALEDARCAVAPAAIVVDTATLPRAAAAAIAARARGVTAAGGGGVEAVLATAPAPLTAAQALPIVREAARRQAVAAATDRALRALRAGARIEIAPDALD